MTTLHQFLKELFVAVSIPRHRHNPLNMRDVFFQIPRGEYEITEGRQRSSPSPCISISKEARAPSTGESKETANSLNSPHPHPHPAAPEKRVSNSSHREATTLTRVQIHVVRGASSEKRKTCEWIGSQLSLHKYSFILNLV